MSRLKQLVRETHRRSLWQVLGLYLGASWIAFQVVKELTETIGFPEWVPPAALALLVIGFPIVLATAFVQEGMGSGASSADADAPESDGQASVGRDAAPAARGPGIGSEAVADTGAADRSTRHGLLTWRNAILGGVVAFALLGLGTAGYMALRTLGIGPAGTLVAKGVLDERAPVLLSEFASADSSLARAATEGLRVDLSQSRVVRLVEPDFVRRALERMQRSAESPIDLDLGREIARREGIPAVIGGEINPAGTGYVITARVVDPEDGEILVSHKESASGGDEVIGALDRLSRRIRERIGESFRAFRAERPLERVTTADLDALRRYSQAIRAIEVEGNDERGIALLEEAVARDSAFAMAWRKLGVTLGNREQERARQVEALSLAYEHRDRLTDRERYLAEASYFEHVVREPDRAVTAYENMLDLDPDDMYALNNLGILYGEMRRPNRAEELYSRALEADSAALPPYFNLVISQINQGETAEAWRTLETLERHIPGTPRPHQLGFYIATNEWDWPRARRELAALQEDWGSDLFWRSWADNGFAAVAQTRGRLEVSERRREAAADAAAEQGVSSAALSTAANAAWLDLLARENPEAAVRRVEALLERYPLEEMDPLDRPYVQLAELFALAERPDRAASMLQAFEEAIEPALRDEPDVTRARATVALAEGRLDEAIEGYRRADRGGCLLCVLPGLALAYDRSGRTDSALAVYERYASTSFDARIFFDQGWLARTHERLGQLYDERGEPEKAAEHYAAFVELWTEADEELRPRVRAAQARLEEIVAERG